MSALEEKFAAVRSAYPQHMSASLVLPLLYAVQEVKGHVTPEDATLVAQYAKVPVMQVMEALSWYTMLNREPTGRYVIKVCRNIACSLRGAERIMDHVQRKLGLEPGETTADGRFTFIAVECLASCGTAPAMQVNDTYHENLDEAKVDGILEALK